MKRVLIAGASGMVGSLVLKNCIESKEVGQIVSLVRQFSNNKHPKVIEVSIDSFTNYTSVDMYFKAIDAAFFCIGAYSGDVPDKEFKKITIDYAVAFAQALKQHSPNANLCLLSGGGADRTGKSKIAFARYKGIAEEQISKTGLHFFTFRPGYIYPVTKRREPNFFYRIMRFLYPLIRHLGRKLSIKSTDLAKAMFKVGISGNSKEILENEDILDVLSNKTT